MYGQDSKLMLEGTELEESETLTQRITRLVVRCAIFGCVDAARFLGHIPGKKLPGTHPDNPINFKVDYIDFNDDNSGVTLGFNPLPPVGVDSLLYADEEDMEEMTSRLAEIRYCLGSALEGFNFVMLEYGKPVHRTPIVKLPDGRYRTEFAIAKGDYM